MEYHIVVAQILLVLMPVPVRRLYVYFDIPRPNGIANLYFCIEKVGAGIAVVKTRMHNFNLFA
jgi:hypothetical protein